MASAYASKVSKHVAALHCAGACATVLLLLIIVLVGGLAIRQLDPPHAVPKNAPISEFSSARAMAHLHVIAKKPRPQGSAEHSAVRNYISQQLSSVGVAPQIQRTAITTQDRKGIITFATVENIVAKLAGTGGGKSLVLASHYDSVPASPGASDDGAGVAAMLETLRALRNRPALKNDIIFLFTDGEEAGLLGAKAFVAEHSLALNVGAVLNFEARGSSGPAIMFETNNGNDWLIPELAQVAPHPIANSLAQDIYKLLPSDTDFSVFKDAGWAGFNFAYISGLEHYHTMLDSLENIDERSLQHQGTYALALSQRLGNMDLSKKSESNSIYFNLAGWGLVHYSNRWTKPLAAFAWTLYVGLLIFGIRRKKLAGAFFLRGIAIFFAAMMISPIVIALISLLIDELYHDYKAFPQGDTYNIGYYLIGYSFMALAIVTTLYGYWQNKATSFDLAMGAMFWWLVLLTATCIFIPGGSYLFVWPLLCSLTSLWACLFVGGESEFSPKWHFLPLAGALPGIILWSPMIYLVSQAFGLSLAPIVISLVVLVTGLLVPYFRWTWMPNRWLLPGILVTLGVISISIAVSIVRFDRKKPRPTSLFYAMNADAGKAVWATIDRRPNTWTSQFLTEQPKRGPLNDFIPSTYSAFLHSHAPVIETATPETFLISQSIIEGVKISHFNIRSPRKAPIIFIYFEQGSEIISCSINGKTVNGGSAGRLVIKYLPLPVAGLEMVIKTKASSPIKLRVTDLSYDLPSIVEPISNPRPGEFIPSLFPYSDTTFVSKMYSF